jgi:hypothetical protein
VSFADAYAPLNPSSTFGVRNSRAATGTLNSETFLMSTLSGEPNE